MPTFVDWDLMQAGLWFDTPEFPDRKERRMAECLVYERVPWSAVQHVVSKNEATAGVVRAILSEAGHATPVTVRGGWYF